MKNALFCGNIKLCSLTLGLVLLASTVLPAHAAPTAQATNVAAALLQPQKIILTPHNARLHGEVALTAEERHGQSVLLLTLPQGAQEITLDLLTPHTKALRDWRTEPVLLAEGDSTNAKAKAALQAEMDNAQARIDITRSQQDVLRKLASNRQNATPAETQKILQDLEQQLPPLAAEQAAQERKLKALQDRLALLPPVPSTAVQAVIALHGVNAGAKVTVRYAYTLPKCGWTPSYVFDAQSAHNVVAMRMLAEVWQSSGMDWNAADIVLTTSSNASRAPLPVFPWVIRKGERMEARPMMMTAPMPRMAAADMAPKQTNAAPEAFENDAQSGWTLPKGTPLPEGRTRLPILEQVWKAPLQRVARPSESASQVWLTAQYALQGQSLPAGEAVYLLDGTATGTGHFAPRNGEATLFFGADPLVTVQATPDTRLTGKAGVLNKRQTWEWAWTYTVRNERTQDVDVRLEVADPQSADKDITVTLKDTPKATADKENILFWNVQVPAGETSQVRHEVTVSAPQNMPVWTGR